ncbi:MAG: hypothetical protein WCE79_11865 [Xanthobacteraceae bacterium]
MGVLFAQTSGSLSITGGSGQHPIPGLELTLPRASGEQALVTLNVPESIMTMPDKTQGEISAGFAIVVDGTRLPHYVQYAFPTKPGLYVSPARIHAPMTLIAAVPLTDKAQKVTALWWSQAATTLGIPSSATASLSAVY